MAHEASSGSEFRPYIPPEQSIAEFTLKAILLGAFFGIFFGAATVYLALRAGLTVSASVPIAVLAIAVFKKIGKSTILENNIVQTIGSAGESVAAGVVFTIPALLFLANGGEYFHYLTVFGLSVIGGTLGVLFMIPLRRALIVKEHGNLKYPEGVACADVLIAGERGGDLAKMVFSGVGAAVLYKFLYGILGLWRETATWFRTTKNGKIPDATLSCDVTPEYLGLGYIIGPRIAGELASGGVLSWLALIPLISIFVDDQRIIQDLKNLSFTDAWIQSHSHAEWIYRAYVRYIGAGAVACAGVMTLIKTLPTIVSAFRESVKSFGAGKGGAKAIRTEEDLPMSFVVIGSLVLALLITILPGFPHGEFPGSLLMGLLVIVFGFFFVTVSSRIVGIIGTSSNPISGMTIATIMATCVVFVFVGRTGDVYQAVALCVGAIVCVAAANAGATSQDLKTGYIVGATPRRQQIGFIIGVVVSSIVIGGTLFLLDRTYREAGMAHGIGGSMLPAPQATLMATIIKGLLAQNLPWAPVLVGVFLAFMAQMAGAHALSWAVGAYLPLSTTLPIFIGGLIKGFVDRKEKGEESELSSGMLYSTGLVAGGSLMGVVIAMVAAFGDVVLHWSNPNILDRLDIGSKIYKDFKGGVGGDVLCAVAFGALCLLLYRNASKKMQES
ncbi:MAG TPA: oligopeptide transporter, OPT family [Thermoanaerobaculia bacterium]|jgi:putative OPT family oligopeptide transporter|nr:oligopeptide transporter, OPT family [Thermoanaerobaculia bacterium]